MSIGQERMQILKMIESGRITAEEGAKLLGAIEETAAQEQPKTGVGSPRWLRIRVSDIRTSQNKVNVNIPLDLVNIGMRLGARFAPGICSTDLDKVSEAIERGIRGKIIDVEDQEDGERVEIYVE